MIGGFGDGRWAAEQSPGELTHSGPSRPRTVSIKSARVTPEIWNRIETLFDAALQLPPEQRHRFLDEQCGSDVNLRDQIAEMLRNDGTGAKVQYIVQQAAAAVAETNNSWEGRRLPPIRARYRDRFYLFHW